MCNRYASDIRKAGKEREYYGFDEWSETCINSILEVCPKSIAPIIKLGEGGAPEWARMRWGLPGPPATGGAPVTNIRNTKSAHWRRQQELPKVERPAPPIVYPWPPHNRFLPPAAPPKPALKPPARRGRFGTDNHDDFDDLDPR